MKRLQGSEIPAHLSFDDFSSCDAVKSKWDEAKGEFLDYVYSLNQTQLDELVHYEIVSRGVNSDNPRWELLMHIANHAADHRAQILAMLDNHFSVKSVE